MDTTEDQEYHLLEGELIDANLIDGKIVLDLRSRWDHDADPENPPYDVLIHMTRDQAIRIIRDLAYAVDQK